MKGIEAVDYPSNKNLLSIFSLLPSQFIITTIITKQTFCINLIKITFSIFGIIDWLLLFIFTPADYLNPGPVQPSDPQQSQQPS